MRYLLEIQPWFQRFGGIVGTHRIVVLGKFRDAIRETFFTFPRAALQDHVCQVGSDAVLPGLLLQQALRGGDPAHHGADASRGGLHPFRFQLLRGGGESRIRTKAHFFLVF